MSLGYDIAQALPGLRAEAESRMTDQCKVTRSGTKVWDEANGEWVSTEVVGYTGRCRVKHATVMGSRNSDAGSQLVGVSLTEIHLPVGAHGIAAGDAVTITVSDTRPEQVGRQFVVVAKFDGSQTTALRFRVEAFDER